MRHLFLRQTGARPRLDQDRDKGELLFQRFILAPRTSFSVGVFEPSEPRVLKLGYAHQGTESFCERCEEGHNGIELPVVSLDRTLHFLECHCLLSLKVYYRSSRTALRLERSYYQGTGKA